ncbi:DUF4214 domain-containing protein [Stutzerimonas stutzeri]|uniref:DUF4214 domain-containing protein n=1 Tax=Stutzerimonas stutzeri TaxID=316 RepID=UPI00210DC39B|nr:DUF4214 domain-containing protein [Stutzerimonas stutzeri]MCQ4224849.1 DUF4214 domain-containing protein [Stutzerimonas stutzeri]MDH1586389.1 DUF4214 domain-containing protein [Stutzerimonas stutzeri]
MATVSDLQQLYIGYFGRAADQAGLNFWLGAINNDGLSLDNVHAAFVNSEEYTAQYEGLTVSQKVAAVYQNVLGRAADAEGQAFWTNAIETGVISEDQLIEGLLSGLSKNDALAVSNKVIVANYYTSARGDAYAEADKADSAAIISGVTSDLKTVGTALATIQDEVIGEEGASNAELAAALATLNAAIDAQEAYAKAVLGDDYTGTDPVGDAKAQLNDELAEAETALFTLAKISADDSAGVRAAKIQDAQNAAAKAVTDATTQVAKYTGLPTLAKTQATQQAALEAAQAKTAEARLAEEAEIAAFNVVNGKTDLTVDDTGAVTGVIAFNPTTGALSLEKAFVDANAGVAGQAKLAAANALLADIQARLNAEKAEDTATKALADTTGKIAALPAVDGVSATDAVANLNDANKARTDLADAVKAYADAQAAVTEFEGVEQSVTDARDVLEDLGYNLVSVKTGAVDATAEKDVFVFEGSEGAADASIDISEGDVLFIGANYKLGTIDAEGKLVGDNNAFEIFFVQSGANTVEIHVENSVFGSSANTAEVTTIALTGVTSVDQLSFDAQTGLVTFA